jgi:hypothetical protein
MAEAMIRRRGRIFPVECMAIFAEREFFCPVTI